MIVKRLTMLKGPDDAGPEEQEHIDDEPEVGDPFSRGCNVFVVKFREVTLDRIAQFRMAIPAKETKKDLRRAVRTNCALFHNIFC